MRRNYFIDCEGLTQKSVLHFTCVANNTGGNCSKWHCIEHDPGKQIGRYNLSVLGKLCTY